MTKAKLRAKVEFKRDSRHGKVSYGKKKNDPDMIMMADEDIGGYARNNAPFNTFADENIGGYARNNAPFNTYGDENFEDVGGFYRTANGERVRIRRFGNKGYGVFHKNGDHVVYHRRDGKVIKRVEFKRDSRHGKV